MVKDLEGFRAEASTWSEINGASHYLRSPPNLFNFYCEDLPLKQFFFDEIGKRQVDVPPQDVYFFSNAYVSRDAICYTEYGNVISVTTIDHVESSARPELSSSPIQSKVGGDCILLFKAGFNNYGHLLIEMLPKLAIAHKLKLNNPVLLIPPMPDLLKSIVVEVVELVYQDHFEFHFMGAEGIRADALYIPGPISKHNTQKSVQILEFWENVLELHRRTSERSAFAERIYVSRRGATNRAIPDELMIERFLSERGFTIIHPETLSFFEQIEIFSSAKHVIGPLGAGLTTVIFSNNEIDITMLDPGLYDFFFYDLCSLRKQNFNWIFTQKLAYKTMDDLHRPSSSMFQDIRRPLEWIIA